MGFIMGGSEFFSNFLSGLSHQRHPRTRVWMGMPTRSNFGHIWDWILRLRQTKFLKNEIEQEMGAYSIALFKILLASFSIYDCSFLQTFCVLFLVAYHTENEMRILLPSRLYYYYYSTLVWDRFYCRKVLAKVEVKHSWIRWQSLWPKLECHV